jgi:tetratricopeptide (TPR) repeat protein
MNAERWRRIEDLFHQAADLPPAQRSGFLDEACAGDDDLRRDVDALLAHDVSQDDATQDGAMQAAVGRAVEQLPDDSTVSGELAAPFLTPVPVAIGRYRILRRVAEGGMGIVYEAEQEQPRRVVALKVIKPGRTSPELLRRFDQESQALGRLQHPGIAQIYEAGAADTGSGPQPYFAMEFIRGQSLLDYAEAHGLNTRQRLEMVAKICDAVHHAHQRGLIHRDLKPGNILVDETGQPKILDFGIARATDRDAQTTRQTDVGQLVGTLAYMSPEQVLGDPLEIDTRSDVYALGVVLFELLVGRLPYKISGQLHQAMQTIREEDPATLSSISRVYRGDIETIVAKALEKDKSRRYASAAGLADDIHRYLHDEPIIARPPSASYQLRKFARRHKALVSVMAAVFVALVAGIVASTREATRARRAEQTATAVDDFLRNDLLAQASASVQAGPDTKPDANLKVRTALDRAAARIEGKFKEQPLVEAAIRQTIGNTYRDLGLYPEAQRQLERAVELRRRVLGQNHPDTLNTSDKLAVLYWRQGKYVQAEPLCAKVLEVRRRVLGEEHPDTLDAMESLALLYKDQGRYALAEPLYKKVLESQRRVLGEEHEGTLETTERLALLYLDEGKYTLAEPLYIKVTELQRRVLGEEHPSTLDSMNNLAVLYLEQDKYKQAEPLLTKVLEVERRVLGNEHPDTLATMNNLAVLYRDQGKYAQAEPLVTKALEVSRRVQGEEHPDTLISTSSLAQLYVNQGQYARAEPLLIKCLDVGRRVLGEKHPDTLTTMNFLAVLYIYEGKSAQAEPLLVKAMDTAHRALGDEHPATLASMLNLALLYRDEGKYEQAERLYLKVLDLQRRVLGPEHPKRLASMNDLAFLYLSQGNYAQAEPLLHEALNGYQKSMNDTWDRYNCQSLLGASLAGQEKYAEAEPLSVSGYEGMLQREATIPAASRFKLRQAGEWIIQMYQHWGKPEKAAMWKQKLQPAKASVAKKP